MTELARGTAHGWNVLPSTGDTWTWSAWCQWGGESGCAESEAEAARRARAALLHLLNDRTPRRAQ